MTRRLLRMAGDAVRVSLATSAGTSFLEGSDILVATGRIPNTQNVGLDKTGVALGARGYIQVNERLSRTQTSANTGSAV